MATAVKPVTADGVRNIVSAMSDADKTAMRVRMYDGDPHVAAELRAGVTPKLASDAPPPVARTVAELRRRADRKFDGMTAMCTALRVSRMRRQTEAAPCHKTLDKGHATCLEDRVMAQSKGVKPTRVKVQEHRDRLRAQGLRPIQIWVPDVRASSFRSEAHRQSLAVAANAHAAEDQAFIDAVSDRDDE